MSAEPDQGVVAALASCWGLDCEQLRRTLDVARATVAMYGPLNGVRKPELETVAKQAAMLAATLEKTSLGSLVHMLMGSPRVSPFSLLHQPEYHRQKLLQPVNWIAELAGAAVRQLEVSQAPKNGRTAPPTALEIGVVGPLADLYQKTHGERVHVTDHKSTKKGRQPNQGGRFVIEAAQLLGLELTAQRLGTVIARLERQRREIAENAAS